MWDACCRSFEPFEVVGLIFHKPEFVKACSEDALDKALTALLAVIKATTDKVDLVSSRHCRDPVHVAGQPHRCCAFHWCMFGIGVYINV